MELKVLNQKGVDIQKDFIGIFFEDINYSADGGIYAQMIENFNFEALEASGKRDDFHYKCDGLYGWKSYPEDAQAVITLREENSVNVVNPHYLHVDAKSGQGFMNKAYDGVLLEKGKEYHLSFWAKGENTVHVGVLQNGLQEVCKVQVSGASWKKYEIIFKSDIDVRKAPFVMTLENAGELDFDYISLFPGDAVCGVFRKDLLDLLKELQPGFIRFPGGCIVEGAELDNRYQWKKTVGKVEERKNNWNRWAVHLSNEENNFTSIFSHYNQTLGLGYFEYFLLCEAVGAKAIPVANVGLACQYQSSQLVERDDPSYREYIQDVVDLIEFANGDVSTKWGSLRAEMGHPAPFNLEMVGIGNEQWQTEQVDFFERYDDFEEAIHKVYPEIKLIGSAGPTVFTQTYDDAWKNIYQKAPKNDKFVYAVDEHYYMEPKWFLEHTHFYDNYDRSVKVFSGEYATHEPEIREDMLRNNLRCAVAEAAFMTGNERNADVVYLSSYAPLFARIGYVQWSPDLIWFDDKDSYGTPSYYVQKMFRRNVGDYTLVSHCEHGEENLIFHSVSYDVANDKVVIKIVNAADKDQELSLDVFKQYSQMKIETMTGDPLDVNSMTAPTKVAPTVETKAFDANITLVKNSVAIISLM